MAHRRALRIEGRRDKCEQQHVWCWRGARLEAFLIFLLVFPLSVPTEFYFSFTKFSFSFCCPHVVVNPVARTGTCSCAKWRGNEGCLPYLCSQQGIKLLFHPGSRPCSAGYCSQDGAFIHGLGICPLPIVCIFVCSLCCSCLHISSVLPLEAIDYSKERISHNRSLTIASSMRLWLPF